MGGGRGLLGRERLGPGGGCSREVLWPRQWPLRRSSRLSSRRANPSLTSSLRDVPRAPVPSRAVLAFVPGIAPGTCCCGWASPWSPPPPSPASRPLPRTLGLRAALQLQTGPLLHIGHTTRSSAAANRPLPDDQAWVRVPRPALPLLSPPSASADRLQPPAIWTRPEGIQACHSPWTTIQTAGHCLGGAGQPFTFSGTPSLPTYSQRHLLLLPDGCQVPVVPGSPTESLIFSWGPFSFAQNPVLF